MEAEFEGIADRAVRRLTLLDSAEALNDLGGMPSNRLEELRGAGGVRYGMRINARWRLCFRMGGREAVRGGVGGR